MPIGDSAGPDARRGASILFTTAVPLLVAASGFSSLVCQVVWDRVVRSHFGGDNVSSAIVTASFLLGLGFGAYLFGRPLRRPYVAFSIVEAGIALFAILSLWVLGPLADVIARSFVSTIDGVDGVRTSLVVACAVFLLPPCVLMGGTLPLLFACFVDSGSFRSQRVGWLYGANTAGAAIGACVAPFALLNHLSLQSVLTIAGCINFAIALAVLALARLRSESSVRETSTALPPRPSSDRATLSRLRWISFGCGAASIAFEVTLFRHFFAINPSSAYNFPLVIVPFLLAIAIGSALLARVRDQTEESLERRMRVLASCAALAVGATVALASAWIGSESPPFDFPARGLRDVGYALAIVMPVPLLLSGVFPLLLRRAARTPAELPSVTGDLYLANSLGAFAGAMSAQLLGFASIGTRGVLTVVAVLLALVAFSTSGTRRAGAGARLLLPAAALAGIVLLWLSGPWFTFGRRADRAHDLPTDRVEGETGVAALEWNEDATSAHVASNGQGMSALPDHSTHLGLAVIALAHEPHARILVLGLGGGGMVKALADDPTVARVEVIDWSHELPRVLDSPRARAVLGDALHGPKVKIRRCDARVAVALYESESFDVVIDNLAPPNWVGASTIKTVSYFSDVRRILSRDGLFCYNSIGLPESCLAAEASLTRAFKTVRWHTSAFVLGSERAPAFSTERLESLLAARADALGLGPPPRASWLLGNLSADRAREVASAEPIREDLLKHEYIYDSLLEWLGRTR